MDNENQSQETQEQQATEAPEAEQQEAPQEEAPETPEAEEPEAKADGEEAEGEEEDEAEETTDSGQAKGARKRKTGYQRRLERLERHNEMLMQELAARGLQRPEPQQQQPEKELTPEEKARQVVRAMILEESAAVEAERKRREAAVAFQQREQAARAKYRDFDEAIRSVAHIPVPQATLEALSTSELAPDIMYSLASNPAELARISALPPIAAAREIGRLEAKLAAGATPEKPKPVTRPPPPPTTVGGSMKSTRDITDLPLAEYKRRFRSGRG